MSVPYASGTVIPGSGCSAIHDPAVFNLLPFIFQFMLNFVPTIAFRDEDAIITVPAPDCNQYLVKIIKGPKHAPWTSSSWQLNRSFSALTLLMHSRI